MKNLLRAGPLVLALLLAGNAAAETVEMEVNGLVCAFCAQGIEKTLKGFAATEAVLVSLEQRLVAVTLKPGTDIDDATLRHALTEAGYSVVALRRSDTSLEALRERTQPHD